MTATETTATNALPKKAGLVDLDRTRERLTKLGLVHAAETLSTHVGVAVKEAHAPHRFLDDLLEAELLARDERRVRTSLRLAGLPTGQTLASFDFGFQPSVERGRIETVHKPPRPTTYRTLRPVGSSNRSLTYKSVHLTPRPNDADSPSAARVRSSTLPGGRTSAQFQSEAGRDAALKVRPA